MENEVQEATAESEQVQVPAVDQPTDDADLQAGFNAVQGIEEPTKPEPEPPKLIAGYTEEEVKKYIEKIAELERRESKVFGSLGSLKQSIDSLKTQQTPQQPLALSPDKFKRLSAEFPEIAEMLAEDLKEMSVAEPQRVNVEEQFKTSLEKQQQAFEAKLLTIQHRDWQSVVKAEDFINWKQGLSEDERNELENSWDAAFIGQKISDFKDWRSKQSQANQTKQKRLEAAITPKGAAPAGKPSLSESEAFAAAFNKARGLSR